MSSLQNSYHTPSWKPTSGSEWWQWIEAHFTGAARLAHPHHSGHTNLDSEKPGASPPTEWTAGASFSRLEPDDRISAARRAGKQRKPRVRQKFLPRQMLWLMAKRLLAEEYADNSATHLHGIWTRIIFDEKMFPETTNKQRVRAQQLLNDMLSVFKDDDDELFDRYVPDHLRDVLDTKQRRNIGMIRRVCELIGWPDDQLWRDIAIGFQSIGVYENGQGLELDEKDVPPPVELPVFLNGEIQTRERGPLGFDEATLTDLAKEVDDLLDAKRIVEISADELLVSPATVFPKVEMKIDGKKKTRILVDERKRNKFLSTRFKARLNGSRIHTELLAAYAAEPGNEQAAKLPTSQSRRDLHSQITQELQRLEASEGVSQNSQEIFEEIRKAMRWVSRPKFLRRKYERWVNAPASPEVRTRLTANSDTGLGSLPRCNASAPDLTQHERDALARGVRNQHGAAARLELGTRDFSKAYYQVGVRDPHLCPMAWYDPRTARWRYALSKVLNMGSKFSVPSWCRIANFMEAACAALGRVVCPIYIDDAAIFGMSNTIASGLAFYETLCDALGLELSMKAESNQESANAGLVRLLGLDYKWARTAGLIVISVPQVTVDKALEAGRRVLTGLNELKKDTLASRKDIEVLAGGATFIVCASAARAGLEVLRPLHEWAQPEIWDNNIRSKERRAQLRTAVKGVLTMLENPRPVIIGARSNKKLYVLITDASGADPITDDEGRVTTTTPWIGAMLWTPEDDGVEGNVLTTRLELSGSNETRIAVLEARAVALGLATWEQRIAGHDVLAYLDNTNAAFNFVKAGGRNPHTAAVAVDVALWGFYTDTRLYYQYVRTDLNPADALTRNSEWQDLLELFPEAAHCAPILPDVGNLKARALSEHIRVSRAEHKTTFST